MTPTDATTHAVPSLKAPPETAWVSVEGINGVGKSYLCRRAAAALGDRCAPLVELPDTPAALLPGQIIAALRSAGDAFLRTGHPRTETLLLAALQVHRYEAATASPGVVAGRVVLEDRGPHSVAVYQAAILTSQDASDAAALRQARAILDLIAQWRPPPTTTLLVVDDPGRCLDRFSQRLGRPVTDDERALITRVTTLYELLAGATLERFTIIDRRRMDEKGCVAAIVDTCQHAAAVHHAHPTESSCP